MEILRPRYLNDLIFRKHNGMIKVITGIRRCGKSYLLNKIFYQHLLESGISASHIIRFAFDSNDDLLSIGEDIEKLDRKNNFVSPKKFTLYIKELIKEPGPYYLLLDEVQLLENFEFVLNGYLRNENLDVYVTGSNSKFLATDVITEFAGRGDEIHMLPLSFSEFLPAFSGNKEKAFENYSLYGGLPAIALMQNDAQKSNYLFSQLNNVYLRDIVCRHNLHSDTEIGELLDIIASGIACLVNPSKLANTFHSVKHKKLSEVTIEKYISIMREAYLLNCVRRFDVKGKKYISTPYKIYFEDIGLRNARLNFRQMEATHLMENIIYNELRYRGFNVDVGEVIVVSRDKDRKSERRRYEIDFLANLGSRRYYIQSAYDIPDQEKLEQEISPFKYTGDSFKKIVLVEKPIVPRYDDHGILFMGILDFLTDPNSLER